MPSLLSEGPCKRDWPTETKKRLTQKEIEEFERKYGRTSAEFRSEFEQGSLRIHRIVSNGGTLEE